MDIWLTNIVFAPRGVPVDDVVKSSSVGFAGFFIGQDMETSAIRRDIRAFDCGGETAHVKDVIEVSGLDLAQFHAFFDNEHVGGVQGVRQHCAAADLAPDVGRCPRWPGRGC